MLARGWLYLIAAGGLIAVACVGGLAHGQMEGSPDPPDTSIQSPPPQGNTNEETSPEQADPEAPGRPTAIFKSEGRAKEASETHRPAADYQKEDLEAQQSMAWQARRMADLTAAQIVVGTLTLLGLAITIYYSRKTAVAAIDAANAGTRQAKLAEEAVATTKQQFAAFIRAERPFLFLEITEPGIEMLSDGQMRFAGKRIGFQFTNYGRTPALLHEINETYTIVEGTTDAPRTLDPKVDRGRMQPVGVVSAAGAPHKLSAYLPNVADINPMLDKDAWKTRRIFLQGFVRFSDPFGTHYITGFLACFKAAAGGWELRGGSDHNYSRVEKPEEIPADPY